LPIDVLEGVLFDKQIEIKLNKKKLKLFYHEKIFQM
jgi:hypothetical protein